MDSIQREGSMVFDFGRFRMQEKSTDGKPSREKHYEDRADADPHLDGIRGKKLGKEIAATRHRQAVDEIEDEKHKYASGGHDARQQP